MERLNVGKRFVTGLGLASNVYKIALESGEITLRELITWAAGRGFSWMEVRDPDVKANRKELQDIKALADKLNVRIHYAWDNPDILTEDERFYQGIENASIFGEGTCSRVLLAPKTVAGRKGYTSEEMEQMVPIIKKYVKRAEEKGVYLCFENDKEPLYGDGTTYFGMNDLLNRCPGMCVTFDPANATKETIGVISSEEELLGFYQKYRDRIFYLHLKVTRDNKALDTIELDGDFQVERLFKAFSSNPEMKICLEIPRQTELVAIMEAVSRSLEALETFQNTDKW